MNNDDDFGQYHCIAENIHGRMEAIVFVLGIFNLSFVSFCHSNEIYLKFIGNPTTTSKIEKPHRHSKHYSPRTGSNRLITSKDNVICLFFFLSK